MSITSGIDIPCHKHRYPANGMPARGISGAFFRWLVCKYFAIPLVVGKMGASRFVFFRRQCIRAEINDSAPAGNTDCQEMRV
ncbi:hypothetical protein [uncultured Bacteroides sp.]|uniref:hypothetical protein n=1 Tax=uncultured Bacteroides sp. TaxID=162156 RepID=UPI0025E4A21A|nr:hypothetical protein [uncultured Bacteroides sp.]